MKEINGNFEDSIMKSSEVLNIVGKVMPVTLDEMKIVAELANGYIVEEKSRIPEVVSEKVTKINRIMLNPSNCRPAPGVIETIKNADCIIIGPGSLYTNVIPNLLVNGIAKAIKESTAIKVYILLSVHAEREGIPVLKQHLTGQSGTPGLKRAGRLLAAG